MLLGRQRLSLKRVLHHVRCMPLYGTQQLDEDNGQLLSMEVDLIRCQTGMGMGMGVHREGHSCALDSSVNLRPKIYRQTSQYVG